MCLDSFLLLFIIQRFMRMEKKVFKNLSFHFSPFSLQIDTSKMALEFYWTFCFFLSIVVSVGKCQYVSVQITTFRLKN